MKYVRFSIHQKIHNGILNGKAIEEIDGDFYSNFKKTGNSFLVEEVKILAPVTPSKIVCVGLNYKDHAKEMNLEIPENPVLFLKPTTAILNPFEKIVLPSQSNRVDYEGELAFVIKKQAKNVKKEDYKDYILGYTCLNDVTARDLQKVDGQWTRAKSFDTFCPIGPIITDEIEPFALSIRTYLNGKTVQSSNTSNFIFDVPYLLAFISSCMTLNVGDIVTTGTPSGIGALKSGDCVEIEIEGIERLKNFTE